MRDSDTHIAAVLPAPDGASLDAIIRKVGDIWSDLAFDKAAHAQLRRDGLSLDGLRLTGPMPYRLSPSGDGGLLVSEPDGPAAGTLIDLWRLHFARSLRLTPSRD